MAGDIPSGRARSAPSEDVQKASGWFWTAALGVGLIVLVVTVAGIRDWANLRASAGRVEDLTSEVERTRRSIESLGLEIEQMKNDPAWLERVARRELGVVEQGEVVILLPQSAVAVPD